MKWDSNCVFVCFESAPILRIQGSRMSQKNPSVYGKEESYTNTCWQGHLLSFSFPSHIFFRGNSEFWVMCGLVRCVCFGAGWDVWGEHLLRISSAKSVVTWPLQSKSLWHHSGGRLSFKFTTPSHNQPTLIIYSGAHFVSNPTRRPASNCSLCNTHKTE